MKSGTESLPFDGRIAAVFSGELFAGYLAVTVPEIVESKPRPVVYVDMVFARMDAEEPSGWRYEDRADPGTVSARSELESGRLEWYGEIFDLRWLDGDQEVAVRGQVFDEV